MSPNEHLERSLLKWRKAGALLVRADSVTAVGMRKRKFKSDEKIVKIEIDRKGDEWTGCLTAAHHITHTHTHTHIRLHLRSDTCPSSPAPPFPNLIPCVRCQAHTIQPLLWATMSKVTLKRVKKICNILLFFSACLSPHNLLTVVQENVTLLFTHYSTWLTAINWALKTSQKAILLHYTIKVASEISISFSNIVYLVDYDEESSETGLLVLSIICLSI